MAAATASKQPWNVILENIFVVSSEDANVPSGKVYKVLNRKEKRFIVNKNGQRVLLDEVILKWESRDEVLMIVKVVSSVLQSIEQGEVYRYTTMPCMMSAISWTTITKRLLLKGISSNGR